MAPKAERELLQGYPSQLKDHHASLPILPYPPSLNTSYPHNGDMPHTLWLTFWDGSRTSN